jgi:hypothetical protein
MTGVAGFPGNEEGWGRVLLENVLEFAGDTRRLSVLADVRNASGLTTGQTAGYSLSVAGSQEELKVTLAFTEPPAATLAASATVNDLDLEVISPSGTLYRGNWFSGGVSASGGVADAINNLEQVLIPSPEAGDWTVVVRGTAVNQGTQGFALLATRACDDPDADGVCTGSDNCPATRNAGQADTDSDGMGNPCDDDDDNDGLTDAQEAALGTSRTNPDTDGDGFLDSVDNCPTLKNGGQADTDSDGMGNPCDDDDDNDGLTDAQEAALGTSRTNPDTDGDGFLDPVDNCPTERNAGQADTDGDGMGNPCDDDDDNDGVLDSEDNCRLVPNRSQRDTDRDGVGNACDPS